LLKIDKLDYRFNENFLINLTAISVTKKSALKLLEHLTISVPESDGDMEYQRILLKTNVDLCRVSIIQSNIFTKALMANFANSSNFEIR
jgi:hypothetical protein